MPAEGDDRLRHRFAELLGLYTLALAQPVFSVVTHSTEFFSARKTPAAAVVIFALAITFGPPVLALLAERAAEAARAGWAARLEGLLTKATSLGAQEHDPARDIHEFAAGLRPEPRPALHFLHVMAPHRPWGRLPSGRPRPVATDHEVPQAVRQGAGCGRGRPRSQLPPGAPLRRRDRGECGRHPLREHLDSHETSGPVDGLGDRCHSTRTRVTPA